MPQITDNSAYPIVTKLDDGDLVPILDGGQLKKITKANLLAGLDSGDSGGLNPAGAWDAGTVYEESDLVSHASSSWIAQATTTAGAEPGVDPVWQEFEVAGVSDHGELTGLGDDDHLQYALADGSRGAFATEAQGALAASAVQPGDTVPISDGGTGASTAAAARTNLGLGNVDNTADVDKPVSTAQTDAIEAAVATNYGTSSVNTAESTTVTSFGDLTTVGPTVTLTLTGRPVIVVIGAQLENSGGGNRCFMSFTASGANTIAASGSAAFIYESSNAGDKLAANYLTSIAAPTPGETTFTAKYQVDGGTGTFTVRRMHVWEL